MYFLNKEKEQQLKKKIRDSYTDFEDFERNYPDFHKLSEDAKKCVERLFKPITPQKVIKAIISWVAVIITLNYLKEICFWILFAYSWVSECGLFTNPISSLTVVELLGYLGLCLILLGCIRFIYEILKSFVRGWFNWCFCIDAAEEVEDDYYY